MRTRRLVELSVLVAGVGFITSCGGSNAGSKVKPDELKASSALGGTCSALGTATPLVVDLPDRAFLEGAMSDGVVFVNYDCNTLTILDDCRLEGDYTYSGLSRAEELVSLENNDEVAANMMFTGGTGEASLTSGNALYVGMVRVGRKSTAARVARDQAEGSQCDKATHYIRQAVVGAFAMKTAQLGSVTGAVDVFAVGSAAAASTSAASREARDGDLEACQTSKSTDDAPVEGCQSLLRLSLAPVSDSIEQRSAAKDKKTEDAEEKGAVGEATVCPGGMAFVNGKCTATAAQMALTCAPTDSDQCLAACNAGNAESCQFYGALMYGNFCKDPSKTAHCDKLTAEGNEAAMEAEEKQSLEFFRKSCASDFSEGCRWLANVSSNYWETDAKLRAEGLAAFDKACEMGNASACYEVGDYRLSGSDGVDQDEFKGLSDYQRACKLGDMFACRELGEYYFEGKHVSKDPAKGLKFLQQFCEQGDAVTCQELGMHMLGTYMNNDLGNAVKPVKVPNAEEIGRSMLDRGCKLKDGLSCYELGRINYQGGTFDKAKLYFDAAIAADGNYDDAEILLGNMAFNGQGGPVNKAQAVDYWAGSRDDKLLLKASAMLEKGDGVLEDKERAGVILAEYCVDNEDKGQCMRVKGLNASAFEAAMKKVCSNETAWACNEFQTLNPADYKALVTSECADQSDFHCKRAAAIK